MKNIQQEKVKSHLWKCHSHGKIVINPQGQLHCLTASTKYKWHQWQYALENSLQSNVWFGLCLYDSTAHKY